jgi:hypothetical protein
MQYEQNLASANKAPRAFGVSVPSDCASTLSALAFFRYCALRISLALNSLSELYLILNFLPESSLGLFQGFPVPLYQAATHPFGAASLSHCLCQFEYLVLQGLSSSLGLTGFCFLGFPSIVSPLATYLSRCALRYLLRRSFSRPSCFSFSSLFSLPTLNFSLCLE